MKNIYFLFCLFILASITPAKAAIVPAASCNSSDVQNAINLANSGDTVQVPAGTCTWSAFVNISTPHSYTQTVIVIPSAKGITLQGAGVDKTTIILGANASAITLESNPTVPTRITGFTFSDQSVSVVNNFFINAWGSESGPLFRIDDNKFEAAGTNCGTSSPSPYMSVMINTGGYGLIDHNSFFDGGNSEIIHINGNYAGDPDWAMPDQAGSANALYVESNTFTANCLEISNGISYVDSDHFEEAFAGARFVLRYNTINFMVADAHGESQQFTRRSTRWYEIYNNTFTAPAMANVWGWMELRGGSGVVFNNTMTCGPNSDCGTGIRIVDETMNNDGYTCSPYVYPCPDQIGLGENQFVDPLYSWNNGMPAVSASPVVVAGRDFFDNTVKPGYTPFQYPYPLDANGFPNPPGKISNSSVFYISQNGNGDEGANSCIDPLPVSWLNNPSSWGTGSRQIGPGTIIYLCDAITSDITFQGSGTPNNYITIDGSNGDVVAGAMSGTFYETDKSWWKVQNVTWQDGYNRGLINIQGGSNGVFTGNYADDLFKTVPVGTTSTMAIFLQQSYFGTGLPNNIDISNNFVRTAAVNIGDVQADMIDTEGSYNVTIEGNYLEMRMVGAAPYVNSHDDIIQTWNKGGATLGPPYNWTIRYNEIVMNTTEATCKDWTMLQNLGGTNNIYNNLFLGLDGASSSNGLVAYASQPGTVFNIFNNTMVSKAGSTNNLFNLDSTETFNLANNIFYAENGQTVIYGPIPNRTHDLWDATLAPSCSGESGCISGQDPLFTSYANNDYSLQSSSPAIGAGVNLGSPYNTAFIKYDAWPNPVLGQRPSTGAWDIGAYSNTASTSFLYGDVNGDGVANMADAELAADDALGLPVTNFNSIAAEVNGNSTVNIYDAFLISQYYHGQISSLQQ